jgi:hypothetical protein
MLARFDIVLVGFPFTDRTNVKPRPAMVICLSERHQDVLLAFISSKVAGTAHRDELDIAADHLQFSQSGLSDAPCCAAWILPGPPTGSLCRHRSASQ